MSQLMRTRMAARTRKVFGDQSGRSSAFKNRIRSRGFHSKTNGKAVDLEGLDDLGLSDAIRQLFQMTLASMQGYRELVQIADTAELRILAEVVVRQRAAQCEFLAQLSSSVYRQLYQFGAKDSALTEPAAAELQLVWLRAIWSIEQEEFGPFGEHLEQAEALLEDAFLCAASTFAAEPALNGPFRQFALDICGARQRLEVLTRGMVDVE